MTSDCFNKYKKGDVFLRHSVVTGWSAKSKPPELCQIKRLSTLNVKVIFHEILHVTNSYCNVYHVFCVTFLLNILCVVLGT